MTEVKREVAADAEALARHAAGFVVAVATTSTGPVRICLSGGSTPKRLYELLASGEFRMRVPWDRVHWYWGDERFVPPDHPDSTYRMTRPAIQPQTPWPARRSLTSGSSSMRRRKRGSGTRSRFTRGPSRARIAGSTAKYYSVPQATIGAQFGSGKVAMYPDGEWFMPQLATYFGKKANNDNDWDWAPLPTLSSDVPKGLFTVGVGGSYGINGVSKYPEQSAAFLDWYYGDKKTAIQRMADTPSTYNIPIAIDESQIPSDMDPRSKRLLTSVQDALKAGKFGYVTWTWWGPKTDTFIYQGVDKVINGQMSVQDYLKQVDDLHQQELKAGDVPTTVAPKPQTF